LWWTKRHWGRFSPSTSVSPANHSTDFSIIIITRGWHNRPVSGRSVEWTLIPPPTTQIKIKTDAAEERRINGASSKQSVLFIYFSVENSFRIRICNGNTFARLLCSAASYSLLIAGKHLAVGDSSVSLIVPFR
jgi:hypothetical protein